MRSLPPLLSGGCNGASYDSWSALLPLLPLLPWHLPHAGSGHLQQQQQQPLISENQVASASKVTSVSQGDAAQMSERGGSSKKGKPLQSEQVRF